MSDAPQSADNEALVCVSTGPLVGPVLSRVIGMLAARVDWPVDRIDDALLIADAIAAHGDKHARNGHLTVDLRARTEELELRVGSLTADGARGLHSDASLPGVGNVLDRLAQEVSFAPDPAGGGEVLVLRLHRTVA